MRNRFWPNESGASAIEYGLITALIASVIVASLIVVGTNLSGFFASVATNF